MLSNDNLSSNYILKEIQVWLGHSDISVTVNIYSHIDIEMKKNAAQKINQLCAKAENL